MHSKDLSDISSCPLVTIRCITYNHEPYIRQCLEGFVMQKTTFPFEAIVHDDASTDGTAAIIREYAEKYPNIIKPIYETENQYSKHDGSLSRIMNAHIRGKYVAMCEGDDYWIDPLKLQKQVDFLEGHPEYGLCYTKVQIFYQKKRKFGDEWGGNAITFTELLINNTIPTLTCVIRRSLLQNYTDDIKPTSRGWKMGDYPLWLYIASKTKIKYLPFTSGCYRILDNSVSHNTNIVKQLEFVRSSIEIALYFSRRENIHGKLLNILSLRISQIDLQLSILKEDKTSIHKNRMKMLKKMNLSFPLRQNLKTILLALTPRKCMQFLNKY